MCGYSSIGCCFQGFVLSQPKCKSNKKSLQKRKCLQRCHQSYQSRLPLSTIRILLARDAIALLEPGHSLPSWCMPRQSCQSWQILSWYCLILMLSIVQMDAKVPSILAHSIVLSLNPGIRWRETFPHRGSWRPRTTTATPEITASTPDFQNFHTWFSKFPHLIFKIPHRFSKFPHLIFKISHLIFKISTPDFQDFHTWYPKSPHLILKISIPDFQNLHTSTPIFNGAHLTLIQKGTFGQCHRFDLIVWSSIPTSLKPEAIILQNSEKVVLLNRSFLIYMLLCFGPKG